MASSLIAGLLRGDAAVTFNAEDITVFEPKEQRAAQLHADFGVSLATDNPTLIRQSEVVIIAVKPQVLQTVLAPLAADFKSQQPLIISIVAGIPSNSIEKWLDDRYAVVRIMPNTPALVGAGASGMYANQRVTDAHKNLTEQLLNSVGFSCWVEDESDIDTVTALSGSGPAYFMLFIQSLIQAAEAAGLDKETAKQLAVATAGGAAELIKDSPEPIQTLIDNVTSPGGTTERALASFRQSALSNIVIEAFEAARIRSQELADEFGGAD